MRYKDMRRLVWWRASDKNKYGYLLYGESELKRIEKIKMYQEFGFKLKEIKEIIDASILS